MIELNTDAIAKINPRCSVFSHCGGCQLQHISYADELRLKEDGLKKALNEALHLSEDVFSPILASPQEYHYRNRIDLKLIQTKKAKEIFIGFSPRDHGRIIPIEECPIARQEISDFIPELKKLAALKVTDKHKQGNLVVRTGDDGRVFWGGIGRRSLQLEVKDYLWTDIAGRRIFYSLDTFFQANLFILPKFIDHLRGLKIWGPDAVFYDLYGGVGLFGICVADLVGKVVLIEEVGASSKVAQHNVSHNQLKNFEIYEGRVENVLPSMLRKSRPSLLDLLKGLVLRKPGPENIVMVDPPRAGLSDQTVAMLNRLKNTRYLLYLSCNPQTLVANCAALKGKWAIRQVLPCDFFPRTHHLETFVVFERL
jgi:tRNA/tmRNA/rRNA uracil-C5-methylase (TrmA/RlmC/RlmD family)